MQLIGKERTEAIKKERQLNLCMTMADIGRKFGVTREDVRQVLSKAGLPTRKWKQSFICSYCGKLLTGHGSMFCSRECYKNYHRVELQCDQCGQLFRRRLSEVRATLKRRFENRSESKLWFCGHKCQGYWLATNYGFGAYPAHANHYKEKLGNNFSEVGIYGS
jgi:hypothetical protein